MSLKNILNVHGRCRLAAARVRIDDVAEAPVRSGRVPGSSPHLDTRSMVRRPSRMPCSIPSETSLPASPGTADAPPPPVDLRRTSAQSGLLNHMWGQAHAATAARSGGAGVWRPEKQPEYTLTQPPGGPNSPSVTRHVVSTPIRHCNLIEKARFWGSRRFQDPNNTFVVVLRTTPSSQCRTASRIIAATA